MSDITIMWLWAPTTLRSLLMREVRKHTRPRARLRYASTTCEAEAECPHLAQFDCLITERPESVELLLRVAKISPACRLIVLSDRLTFFDALRLQGVATVLPQVGVLERTRDLAALLTAPREQVPEPAKGDVYDTFLDKLEGHRGTFAEKCLQLDERAIRRALAREGSIARTAKYLGCARTTLIERMVKYGIRPGPARAISESASSRVAP